ncbi:MAG: T9SS type A sorting domain-containing protein [bacterium]
MKTLLRTWAIVSMVFIPFIAHAQSFSPLLGLPSPIFAPPSSPVRLPVLFFEQVTVDSQVTSISATIRTHSDYFRFKPEIDTTHTHLRGWHFDVFSGADSVRFEAEAPSGVFFVHTEEFPALLLHLLGDIVPEAALGDSVDLTIHNVVIVKKGEEFVVPDSLLLPGKIYIGDKPFILSQALAAPGEDFEIELLVTVPVPPDSQLSRIRGVLRTTSPEMLWHSDGHHTAEALVDWSLSFSTAGDSLSFDVLAPAGTYLTHEAAELLPLLTFEAMLKPSAPFDSHIEIFMSQFHLTLHGQEISFDPKMHVRPGVVHVKRDSVPPLPPPPPLSTTEGRVNLGLYGGTVLDYAFDEVHGTVLAAVAAPQSVFFSADSGRTWAPAFPVDSLEYITENVIRGFGGRALQVESSKGYSYARTSQEAGTLTGSQVTEDGKNWRTLLDSYLINKLLKQHFPQAHDGPRAIVALSARGPVALVGSENFVFRTPDAGKSWDISALPVEGNPDLPSVGLLAVRGNDPNAMGFYTVLNERWDQPQGTLYRTDDGENFTPLYIVSGSDTLRHFYDLMCHPTNGDTLWVLASFASPNPEALWRSYDAGNTWTQLYALTQPMHGVRLKLYQEEALSGVDHIRLVLVVANKFSDDLGDTWTEFEPQNDPSQTRFSSFNAGLGHIPNTDIYFGQGDGAPSRSTDGLDGTYHFVATGMEAITIWKIAQVPNDLDKVYLATGVGLAFTSKFTDTTLTTTQKWAPPYGNYPINPQGGGNMGFTAVAIDPYDTQHIIAANGNGIFMSQSGGFTSNDWLGVLYEDVLGLDLQIFKGHGGRVSAIAFLTSDSVFAAAYTENAFYGRLLLSTNGGHSWKALEQPGNHLFKSIAVARQVNPDSVVLYASGGGVAYDLDTQTAVVDSGALYKSMDLGTTWFLVSYGPEAVFNPAPFPLPINDLAVKPGSVDTLYLACGENLSNAIARSFDGGQTLHTISLEVVGPREGAFEAVAINKHHPDSVYFAIRRDILVYDAHADMATTLFRGYPGELTHTLHYDELLMGSSVGFFEVKSPSEVATHVETQNKQQPFEIELAQNYPNPFNPSTRIVFTLSQAAQVELEIYNILGQRLAVLLSEPRPAGRHEVVWRPENLSSGMYLYRLKATTAAGKTTSLTKKVLFLK